MISCCVISCGFVSYSVVNSYSKISCSVVSYDKVSCDVVSLTGMFRCCVKSCATTRPAAVVWYAAVRRQQL